MAHFTRTKTGLIKAYYWDETQSKQRQIPRQQYKHLDGASDRDMRRWLDLWEQAHGKEKLQIAPHVISQGDEVISLFDSFISERQKLRNISASTIQDEQGRFRRHVIPYFVLEKKEKDVRRWDKHVADLASYLLDQGHLQINQIKKVLGLLRRFSSYLARRHIIDRPWAVELPTMGRRAQTPLELAIEPEDILAFVKTVGDRDIALMALLGFFASLRPGETFALDKEDFATGEKAKTLCKTYPRFQKKGLGSGLAVQISKALQRSSLIGLPKTHYSRGWVNIWHREAALALAAILKDAPEGRLFSLSRDMLFRRWKRVGMKKLGCTLHDLRRASGLYLGRNLDIELTLLQDHLRHSDVNTTVLYTRAPVEAETEQLEQNWEAVI